MGSSVEGAQQTMSRADMAKLQNVFTDVCGPVKIVTDLDLQKESAKAFMSKLTFTPANISEEYRRFMSNGNHCPDGITARERKFITETFERFAAALDEATFRPERTPNGLRVFIDTLKRRGGDLSEIIEGLDSLDGIELWKETLEQVFAHYAGSSPESGGSYRETSRTRRTARRLG